MAVPDRNQIRKAADSFLGSAYVPTELTIPALEMPDFSNPLIDLAEANTASEFHRRLSTYVEQFENELDEEHEVGMRLVSFGQALTFHVTGLGYFDPSLITFSGQLEDGSPVKLVQHVSQISFLLKSVKRLDPTKPKRRIGFNCVPKADPQSE